MIGSGARTAQGIASSATLQTWVRDLHQKLSARSKKPRIARFVDHVEYAIEQSSRLALHVDTAGSVVIYLDALPVHNDLTSQLPSIDNKTSLETVMGTFVGMVPCKGIANPDLVITYKWGEWKHHGVPCQVRLPGADSVRARMKPSLQPGTSQCPPVIASPKCCHLLPAGSESQCCGKDLQKKLPVPKQKTGRPVENADHEGRHERARSVMRTLGRIDNLEVNNVNDSMASDSVASGQ